MTTSRYGDKAATVFTGAESCAIPIDDIPKAVQEMRSVFNTDKTLSREWRLGQLNAFLKLIREGCSELQEAMKLDLHKGAFECIGTEIGQAEGEILEAIEHLDGWMQQKETNTSALNWPAKSCTQHDPLGVVLVMGAWNYPVNLTFAPIVGAIAGGNCILVRPGSYAVATSHAICRLIHKYMDRECIRVTEGDRHLTTKILAEKWDMIFYTGSEHVGKLVADAAAKHLTPVILELGGKSPAIVDKTAHLSHAAHRIAWGTFTNSGQTCVRPDFCMVHADVADEFFKELKIAVREFYTEDAKKTEFYGRIINNKAHERLSDLLDKTKDKLVFGGACDAEQKYIEPSVYDFGSDLAAFRAHPIMQDETFGPLLPCVRYTNLEDVISTVRTLPTGKPLALYCYSRDKSVIDAISRRTTSGGLVINDSLMHLANSELPFGGVGNSGMGAYHGHYSFKAFTHEKAVLQKYPAIDELPIMKQLLAARFPPYTGLKEFLVKVFSNRLVMKSVNVPVMNLVRLFVKLLVAYCGLRVAGYKVIRG